jgi:hypothetical protein
MVRFEDQALFFIREHFLIPFGFVALLFPLKRSYIEGLDLLSTKLILFIGILYFVFWAKSLTADLFIKDK